MKSWCATTSRSPAREPRNERQDVRRRMPCSRQSRRRDWSAGPDGETTRMPRLDQPRQEFYGCRRYPEYFAAHRRLSREPDLPAAGGENQDAGCRPCGPERLVDSADGRAPLRLRGCRTGDGPDHPGTRPRLVRTGRRKGTALLGREMRSGAGGMPWPLPVDSQGCWSVSHRSAGNSMQILQGRTTDEPRGDLDTLTATVAVILS